MAAAACALKAKKQITACSTRRLHSPAMLRESATAGRGPLSRTPGEHPAPLWVTDAALGLQAKKPDARVTKTLNFHGDDETEPQRATKNGAKGQCRREAKSPQGFKGEVASGSGV